jgi:hypothetical protein
MFLPISAERVYVAEIPNWEEKKESYKKYMEALPYKEICYTSGGIDYKDMVLFYSNKTTPPCQQVLQGFTEVFQEMLQDFGKAVKVSSLKVENVWGVKYKKHNYQLPHTHDQSNMVGIIYYDYDHNVHFPTAFISNNKDVWTGGATTHYSPDVKEGMVCIFPSDLLHYVIPVNTDKKRSVIAFDLNIHNTREHS